MVIKLALFLLATLAFPVWGTDCLLRNYVQNSSVPFREVSFQVPPTGVTVNRVLPTPSSSPELRELFTFMKENRIVLTRGPVPPLAGEGTIYISVGAEAVASEAVMTAQLRNSLRDYFGAPVNYDRLPAQSRLLVQRMRENFNTRFIAETEINGISYANRNMIGLNARHAENLRVNAAAIHEITHSTTDRKVFEAFNPVAGRVAQPLTSNLAGRAMSFRAKSGKTMELPSSLEAYTRFMGSDEVEAMMREMAQAKKDGLSNANSLTEINQFMDAQERNIQVLMRNNSQNLQIAPGEIVDELRAGRRQQRIITTPDANFQIEMLVPVGLSPAAEREFVARVLQDRLTTFQGYRRSISGRFPAEPSVDFNFQ
ncbi:MAG: hypothetical protein V4598_02720 [Bdellovibrionota bacterium]